MSKRTLGPWVPTVSTPGWIKIAGKGGVPVASVKNPADVPLVCTAPVMLDLLKRIVDGLQGQGPRVQTWDILPTIDQAIGYKPLPGTTGSQS